MKILKIAAIVIGAVIVIATAGAALGAFGAIGSLGLASSVGVATAAIGSALGVSAGLVATIGLAALAIDASMLAGAILPKPSSGGSQTKWKADPYAGIPYVIGRTLTAGNIVFKRGHGANNKYLTAITVLGLGPFLSIDSAFADKLAIAFSGGNAVGTFNGQIYEARQLGALPESAALVSPISTPAAWTSAHKLSGLCAVINTWVYDSKSKSGLTSIPTPSWIVHGCKVYDPRADSTYPGGSGSCRAGTESTYVWSENPHLHALTWCIGRFQNGKRRAGIGAPIASIDVASFVEGANLDDARTWTIGGQVYTRPDTLWNSLKAMLQAGGASPVMIGGRIACVNRAPRVSLATITAADIVGQTTFAGTQPRRSRINGIIPQYRSEAHDWELVSATGVSVSSYAALDGDERTREIAYPLVQNVTQATQLATYDICDAREAGPGTVPLKPIWLNYRIGDCLTFSPEPGFALKVIVQGRALDPQTGTVTMTLRGETDGKHAFALGQTGTAPPIASLTYSNAVAAPGSGEWTLAGATLTANGASIPALVVTGASTNPNVSDILVEYRLYATGLADDANWIGASSETPTLIRKEITSVTPGTSYQVSVRYRVRGTLGERLILGPVTAGTFAVTNTAQTLVSQSNAYPLAAAATPSITVAAFTGISTIGTSYSFPSATITAGIAASTTYAVFWNPGTSAYETEVAPAATRMASAALVLVGVQSTPDSGGTYPSGPTAPSGSRSGRGVTP